MAKHISWHLDVGDSSKGPIGFCAMTCAATAEEALAQFKAAVDEYPSGLDLNSDEVGGDGHHLTVYFNADALTIDDVVEDDDCECDAVDDD